jgi:hypothetical protein
MTDPSYSPAPNETGSSGSGGSSGIGTVILVIIGTLIVVLLLLLIAINLFDISVSESTQETPVPVDTALPPPLPTEGPTPTPIAGDPADILGTPTFVDTFDTDENWNTFNNDCYQSSISGGTFNMTAKGKPGFETITCWEATWPRVSDIYLEVEADSPGSCSGRDRWGLFFRGPDTQRGYVYLLSCDGEFVMGNIDGQNVQIIQPFSTSGAVNAGPGQTNRIGVLANGSNFSLYVNGVRLADVNDSAYTSNGVRIGLAIGSSNTENLTVKFDNFAYWELE